MSGDDWTIGNGRVNSSPAFIALCDEVERLIRGDAHKLIAGRANDTACLIMAQLAHKHGLRPKKTDGVTISRATFDELREYIDGLAAEPGRPVAELLSKLLREADE